MSKRLIIYVNLFYLIIFLNYMYYILYQKFLYIACYILLSNLFFDLSLLCHLAFKDGRKIRLYG